MRLPGTLADILRKRRAIVATVLALVLAAIVPPAWARTAPGAESPRISAVAFDELPVEARNTLGLIHRGGPFPYQRDGVLFGNYERVLPARDRRYYREYTVPTPGLPHRGARRIVSGRNGELYYTDDHYRSFKRIRE